MNMNITVTQREILKNTLWWGTCTAAFLFDKRARATLGILKTRKNGGRLRDVYSSLRVLLAEDSSWLFTLNINSHYTLYLSVINPPHKGVTWKSKALSLKLFCWRDCGEVRHFYLPLYYTCACTFSAICGSVYSCCTKRVTCIYS